MTFAEGHPPVHVLAELLEGIGDDGAAGEIQSHVRQCATCQHLMAEVGGVTLALRALPAELPVPEHVSERISAALSAEHAGSEPPEESGAVGHDDDGATVAWFRRRVPRVMAAAASAAVIGLAGYVAVTSTDGSSQKDVSTAGAGDGLDEAEADQAAPGARGAPEQESATQFGLGADTLDVDPNQLSSAVVDVWENDSELASGCGRPLADAEGSDLVGSAEHDSGVLVVLEHDDTSELEGWLVPTCNSLAAEALTSPVTVDAPS